MIQLSSRPPYAPGFGSSVLCFLGLLDRLKLNLMAGLLLSNGLTNGLINDTGAATNTGAANCRTADSRSANCV